MRLDLFFVVFVGFFISIMAIMIPAVASADWANDVKERLQHNRPSGTDISTTPAPVGEVLYHTDNVRNILFAHGYHDDKSAWDKYVDYIKNEPKYADWHVYRTNVDPGGSIENRGSELADYINSLDIDDNSLIAVGHSMGGLDLRYIVSKGHLNGGNPYNKDYKYYLAAKKIHKVYTLATPHGGNQYGGILHPDDGAIDLGIEQMREFNNKYPYSSFSIDSRHVGFLAFRFHCDDAKYSDGNGAIEPSSDTDSDGTVAVKRQILFGAPFTQSIFQGRHTKKCSNFCSTNVLETTLTDTILKGILDNKQYYTDVKDIVFYEHQNCEGDEKGEFSSRYKDGTVNCDGDKRCDNDEISSIKIYPGIKKNTVIALYASSNKPHMDDWTRIHIGETNLTEPFCITGLEHNTSDREAAHDINVIYHKMNGLNGKVSQVRIFKSEHKYDPYDIIFYEDSGCGGNIDGVYRSAQYSDDNCKKSDNCKNDEARSVLIYPSAKRGTIIRLYNDPDGKKRHGWTKIKIDRDNQDFKKPYCISGFNHDLDHISRGITMEYHKHKHDGCVENCGVTGNVSHITISH
ncbi:MAG TPA: hypothetical protein ENK96_07295 [Desulfobulbaceae bacterium]|nr:hypothetical protein [Desulfobulbaceae bacterium]